jgi:hypothetical protein
MLDLVNRLSALVGHGFQPSPHQQRTSNMVALNPGFATLTGFRPCQLLQFAVKLLNLPTDARLLLCSIGGGLRSVVGGDKFRPVGGHRNPEQFHLLVSGKPSNLDELAMGQGLSIPGEFIDSLVRLSSPAVIYAAIALQWTVVAFAEVKSICAISF